MKIVFFDIDGTLINAQEGMMQPRHQTKQVLKDFQKQGNKIVIASARGAIPEGLKDIPFDGYVLCDGHYIIYNNEILVDEVLTTPEIQKQMEVYQKYQGRPMFYGHHGEWCDCLDDELVVKHRVMFQGTDQRPENVVERYEAQDVDAISCCVLFETVEQMWKAYHELENVMTIVAYDHGLIRMDVYHKGFKKGTACKYLYQKLGIDQKDTYAFGDGVNDMEMFELVGHGIAMGNAVDRLKNIAEFVTDYVDCAGIDKAFYKYFGKDLS